MSGQGAPQLPVELLEYILLMLSRTDLQPTTLAVIKACFRMSLLSSALLLRHLRITRPGQAAQCLAKLRQQPRWPALVRTAVVECWSFHCMEYLSDRICYRNRDDPQLIINLVAALPVLTSLRMTIGPMFAPDHLEEMLERPTFRASIQQLWLRFNPYVLERSYYSFLKVRCLPSRTGSKGAYFDTAPLAIAQWPVEAAPHLRCLAYAQDLLPSHGIVRRPTPAFGLQELTDSLDEFGAEPPATSASLTPDKPPIQLPDTSGPRLAKRLEAEKADFAQPIVFHRLYCITALATSPIGSQLTHLVLRLPRRNVLLSLTAYIVWPPPRPFASLLSIDLSTTHIVADQRLPLFLRLHPNLRHLTLDRCSGLIGDREADQPAAINTLKWLGHTCASIGKTRADEALRQWRKLVRDRSEVAAPGSGSATSSAAPMRRLRPGSMLSLQHAPAQPSPAPSHAVVRDLLIVAPPPRLESLGLGLFDLAAQLVPLWRENFAEGYVEAMDRCIAKLREQIARWEAWNEADKLRDGTRRMIAFKEELPSFDANGPRLGQQDFDEDPLFSSFLSTNGMIVVDASWARSVLSTYLSKLGGFILCLTPDCSSARGVAHLSLAWNGAQDRQERERNEKMNWERERIDRRAWRRPAEEHEVGCAHVQSRVAWEEEED
ncbi:BZ3500_MvSof-1268-A1-R1_Chr7-1g09382 [Microbotryum saponariae]|uniref:BZ3500_MvSof-1268-A1-R1_Chr7-1g09382 protein n=1 Tax=Microbotryum saponariae TaxID=289078 RepID=A0A2X0MX01_9BASI|nr:BZ3501_MvSof-1269-A2-R1_Chr7-1g09087 [Microbotryum saponariae]SDA03333.1 BZ3500_MvSof-1268-A1-R1_Chr7-1g09382 [Microbotryum saponariae]